MGSFNIGPCDCCGETEYDCDTCDYDDFPYATITFVDISEDEITLACCGRVQNGSWGPLSSASNPCSTATGFSICGGPPGLPGGYSLECSWGWGGSFCDIDDCISHWHLTLFIGRYSNAVPTDPKYWWACIRGCRPGVSLAECTESLVNQYMQSGYISSCSKSFTISHVPTFPSQPCFVGSSAQVAIFA